MRDPIRILVVDDHPVVRHGLRGMLSNVEEFEIVGEAGNGVMALQLVEQLNPHVVLLDVRMPGQDGIQLARQVKRIRPSTKVIILTVYDAPGYAARSLEAGAEGFLLKKAGSAEIADGIRAVHAGRVVVAQEVAGDLLAQYATLVREQGRSAAGLSETEVRILEAMAGGATYRETARRLFLSEVTVRRKVQQIYRKLNVSDRAEAVATAIREGLI